MASCRGERNHFSLLDFLLLGYVYGWTNLRNIQEPSARSSMPCILFAAEDHHY